VKPNRFRDELRERSNFVVCAELTGGPNFKIDPIEKFLKEYQKSGGSVIPKGFSFAAITLPQNPGGVANIQPVDIINQLRIKDLLKDLEVIPHVTCKDHNAFGIVSLLNGYKMMGVQNILAMTGDKPVGSKGVFELESVGLLDLVNYLNNDSYIKANPSSLDDIHRFFSAAAVSPFKYTEGSLMQQYYKMEKKLAAGAEVLFTQVGWDWRKSQELFSYLKENKINVPVIGNVYFLSTTTTAPRLMNQNKLPGCFVSDEFLAKIHSEKLDAHIERAAQQVAMYKAMGAAGADISGVADFNMFVRILTRAAEIGSNWEQFKENLYWPAANKKADDFYLYDRSGQRTKLSKLKMKAGQKFFNFMHRAVLNPDYRGFHAFKKTMAFLGADKGEGAMYKLFDASEKAFKYLLFECEQCGDCYLPENFSLCTVGKCQKGMNNAPCGDATVDGMCGNELESTCVGELIYNAASAQPGGLEKLRGIINKPRNPALEQTSSILNYLFARDHTMKNTLISIGEAVHASIPKTGEIMKQLAALGPDAYEKESGPLNYIKALIESQVADGADYIAVNLDVFGENDPKVAIDMMRKYVTLVQKWGRGVPICFDSSNDDVLIAGLNQWFAKGRSQRQPLLNSVKVYTMDKILPLKKQYDFAVIALLISEQASTGPGGYLSVDELYGLAKQIYEKAVGQYGFKPQEIFFDSTVFPLAIDMPMEPNVPGYTYRAFETIKKIKSDPNFKGVHCSLGISNSVRDLPGRKVGLCRAYVATAMKYGLDAGIVNTSHKYGSVEPAAELMELVEAYATMNGEPDRLKKAMDLMGKFCRENRKPAKRSC
jgi:5-methyltetrahydrofolate corrinoid/iron sulfur protein methyltransferase